uniref:CWH43-like N-terminal domain-containing protein n=1 Tax=Onchocerca volvulus TaxID=6282 RepID=A0A8R1XWN5_ONCVO
MVLKKVWIIPLLTVIFSLSAFIFSYIIAVSKEHVTAFWPYISDSGTLAPESCIFGQFLNLAALFFAISVYLRHRQLIEFHWHHLKQRAGNWRNYSTIFLWFGYFTAFGISLIGNFQEINFIMVHYIGAVLAFGCGLIYTWGQTIFSYRMQPRFAEVIVSHCRLFLSCLSTIFFTTMGIFGTVLGEFPENWLTSKQIYKWTPESPHYVEHIIATCSEWLLAICFEFYLLTFAFELRNANCHAPKLKLNLDHLYQSYQFNSSSIDKSKLTSNECQPNCNMNGNPTVLADCKHLIESNSLITI